MPAISRPNATLSSTVRQGNRLKDCQTVAMRAGRGIGSPSGPMNDSVPRLACMKPRVICSIVLLPQPLGPMIAVTLPAANRQFRSSSARTVEPSAS